MQMRALGESGIEASVVGLGTWVTGGWMWGGAEESESIRAIQAAIDAGISLVDTAPVYGFGRSESIVGKALQGRRDRVVLATKCGLVWDTDKGDFFFKSSADVVGGGDAYTVHRYLGPDSIAREVEASLKRLRVECIDLMQTHWQETTTPIAETMEALVKLQQEGKIRAIGASNTTTEQLEAYRAAGPLAACQEKFSMLDREREADHFPYCRERKVAFLAYSPLAQGLLTGKVGPDREFEEGDQRRGSPRFSVENRERIAAMLAAFQPVADKHGLTLGQLAIAWTVHQPGCGHALVGARTVAQAEENAKAGAAQLDAEDLATMQAAIEAYEKAADA